MTSPSLLIVVPTLNSYRLLPSLLSSLKKQSWPNWSVLFVDGPSSPEHRQWLQSWCESDPRCSWIPQDHDKPGIFGAMNQVFAEASNDDWLLWGSDDFAAAPDVFAKAMALLENPNLRPDLLVCREIY